MAVSQFYTLGLLNYWPLRMGEYLYHFNQVVGAGQNASLTTPGQAPYVQIEREYINEGMNSALALAIPYLGFYPRPTYLHQRIPVSGWSRYWGSLQLDYGYVQAIGRRATAVIESGAAVTYKPLASDQNDKHVAEIVVTVTEGIDPTEIAVFFREADRPQGFIDSTDVTDDRWRIEPLTVKVVGTTATITGHRSLFVKPEIWAEQYDYPNFNDSSKNTGDTSNANDFVTAVDVYRVYPDATNAIQPVYRDCNRTYQTVNGTGHVMDAGLGIIDAEYYDCLPSCGYPFEYVDVYYYAGLPLVNFEIRRDLQTALIRLGNCEIPVAPNNFDDRRTMVWQDDTKILTENERDTPFGKLNGQVYAWRIIKRLALGVGGVVGRRH
jgi:hypothetical protein